jgi:hypothetical protein
MSNSESITRLKRRDTRTRLPKGKATQTMFWILSCTKANQGNEGVNKRKAQELAEKARRKEEKDP